MGEGFKQFFGIFEIWALFLLFWWFFAATLGGLSVRSLFLFSVFGQRFERALPFLFCLGPRFEHALTAFFVSFVWPAA